MLRRFAFLLVIALGAFGLVPGIASASLCGATITHNVTLHHNVDCSLDPQGTAPAITFGKNGLVLDLNGHKIIGTTGADSIKGVYADGRQNDVIENGVIVNFGSMSGQIYLYNCINCLVRNVRIIAEAADTTAEGIYVEYGVGNRIENVIVDGGEYGLDFYGSAQNVVTDSLLNKPSSYGVYTDYENSDRFIRNRVIAKTTSTYGFYDDSDESTGLVFVKNVANGGYDGFYLYADYDGFFVLRGNVANGNSGYGFDIELAFNEYTGQGSTIVNNTANGNGHDGFFLDYLSGATIVGNTANHNMNDAGLYIKDNYGPYAARTVSNNTANNNSYYGVYAEYGAPGHNNQGHGNVVNLFNVGV